MQGGRKACDYSRGGAFWAEGTGRANARRWEHKWHVGTTKAKWLEQRRERLWKETDRMRACRGQAHQALWPRKGSGFRLQCDEKVAERPLSRQRPRSAFRSNRLDLGCCIEKRCWQPEWKQGDQRGSQCHGASWAGGGRSGRIQSVTKLAITHLIMSCLSKEWVT